MWRIYLHSKCIIKTRKYEKAIHYNEKVIATQYVLANIGRCMPAYKNETPQIEVWY
nr:hypothetical protein [uncultured Prevotella sp.]